MANKYRAYRNKLNKLLCLAGKTYYELRFNVTNQGIKGTWKCTVKVKEI